MPGLTTSVTKSNQHPGLTTITPRGQHSPPVTSDQCNMNNKFMGVYFEFFYIRCLVNNCQFFIRCFDSEEILITCPQSYLTKSRQALLKKNLKKTKHLLYNYDYDFKPPFLSFLKCVWNLYSSFSEIKI